MNLGSYLTQEKISQTKFAEMVGCTQSQIARLITGERMVGHETITEIERVTGKRVQLQDLVEQHKKYRQDNGGKAK